MGGKRQNICTDGADCCAERVCEQQPAEGAPMRRLLEGSVSANILLMKHLSPGIQLVRLARCSSL